MINEDVTSAGATPSGSHPTRRSRGTRARVVALLAGSAIALGACSSGGDDTFIEGYWDNGDEFRSPTKDSLWNDDGTPTCDVPVKYEGFEARATSRRVLLGALFEISNDEPDPATATNEEEREAFEKLQGSLTILYQYTHPEFDVDHGIDSPADLAPVKQEIKSHIPFMYKYAYGDFRVEQHLASAEAYFITDQGRYNVEALVDPAGYLDEVGYTLEDFNGITYTYRAVISDDGRKLVAITTKESGDVRVFEGNEEQSISGAKYFERWDVFMPVLNPEQLERDIAQFKANDDNAGLFYTVEMKEYPEAEFLVASDGCPKQGKQAYERFYVADYALLDPPAAPAEPTDG